MVAHGSLGRISAVLAGTCLCATPLLADENAGGRFVTEYVDADGKVMRVVEPVASAAVRVGPPDMNSFRLARRYREIDCSPDEADPDSDDAPEDDGTYTSAETFRLPVDLVQRMNIADDGVVEGKVGLGSVRVTLTMPMAR